MSEAATRHGRAPPLAASRRGLFVGLASLATALGCGDGTADLPSSLGSAAEEEGRQVAGMGGAGVASAAAGGESFVVVRTDHGGSRGWTSASLDGGYFCRSAADCWNQCPPPEEEGGTTVCDCQDQGGAYWCTITSYDPGEEVPVGGGGESEDEDEDDTDEEEARVVPFGMECDGSVVRGEAAECSVTTTDTLLDMSLVSYAWSAGDVGREGAGPEHSTWGGVATSTATVKVTLSAPETKPEPNPLEAEVKVTARSWKMDASNDGSRQPLVDHGIDPAIWGPGMWGAHIYVDPTPPRAAAGSGPWTGQYYADGPPAGGQVLNQIWIHPDFAASGPKYAGASQIPDTLCASAASLPYSSGVRIVNDACDNKHNLDDWKDEVAAHEQVHAANLAYCLSAAGTKRLLAELEAAIREKADELNDHLAREWSDWYRRKVQPVSRGVTSVSWSPRIFDHRKRSRWTLSSWPVEAHAGLPRSACDN